MKSKAEIRKLAQESWEKDHTTGKSTEVINPLAFEIGFHRGYAQHYNEETKNWTKVLEMLPDEDNIDYDPGDIIMRIRNFAYKNI